MLHLTVLLRIIKILIPFKHSLLERRRRAVTLMPSLKRLLDGCSFHSVKMW